MKRAWEYNLTDDCGVLTGQVTAEDPRDALSRTLSSDQGQLFAKRNGISTDILFEAPGNADESFQICGDGYNISVAVEQNQVNKIA